MDIFVSGTFLKCIEFLKLNCEKKYIVAFKTASCSSSTIYKEQVLYNKR